MSKSEDYTDDDIGFEDEDPIPAKRDTKIFQHKKDDKKEDEDFEEDVFV